MRKTMCSCYTQYQIFLGYFESFLENLHSIYDFVKTFDSYLGKNYVDQLEKLEWFKILIDLRNIAHHNQSPLVSIQNCKILFTIEILPRNPRYFNVSMADARGHFTISIDTKNLAMEIIEFLNRWAKNHLEIVDKDEKIEAIKGFRPNGEMINKTITLKQLLANTHGAAGKPA